MKTLIAGSRSIYRPKQLMHAIRLWPHPITGVITGMARGADMLGYLYAKAKNIPFYPFPAQWKKISPKHVAVDYSAGYARNALMVKDAQAAIVLWDGRSKGTLHTIGLCRQKRIPLLVVTFYYD